MGIKRLIYDFKCFCNPDKRFLWFATHGRYKNMPDEEYLRKFYSAIMGKPLNLEHPITFNEKLQWLKLNNRNPLYTTLVDKYSVKKYISEQIGDEYIIPTLGVWDSFDDIDFKKMPNQFVLKCTHDSGGLVFCRDKSKLNISKAKKKINKSLRNNYYWVGREWPYKDVKPRIIAEKLMTDNNEAEALTDYKFNCFNGRADCVMVCFDRFSEDTKYYFFDEKWQLLRINKRGLEAPQNFTLPKPACIDEMFAIASKLSEGIPYVRVDLYECQGKVYFGEMTFFPDGGFDPNYLPKTDLYFGNLIKLDDINGMDDKL